MAQRAAFRMAFAVAMDTMVVSCAWRRVCGREGMWVMWVMGCEGRDGSCVALVGRDDMGVWMWVMGDGWG